MNKFKEGDRIIVTGITLRGKKGMIKKIKSYSIPPRCFVSFDEKSLHTPYFHNGKGWWMLERNLEKLEENKEKVDDYEGMIYNPITKERKWL